MIGPKNTTKLSAFEAMMKNTVRLPTISLLANFFLMVGIYFFTSLSAWSESFIDQALLINEKPFLVGAASDLKTNQFLYNEYHYSFEEGKKYIVVYKDADDKVIAEKELLYAKALADTNPRLMQSNYLSGERIEVDTLRAGFRVAIEYRESTDDEVKRKEFVKPQGLVVDAGFNQFIVEEWSSLLKDETVRFEYLAPSQQKTFAFTAKKESCDDIKLSSSSSSFSSSFNSNEVTCFSIAPKSWFVRQFVASISLVYDSSSKRLLRFSGLGNIGNASGEYMQVDIRYQYTDEDRLARL